MKAMKHSLKLHVVLVFVIYSDLTEQDPRFVHPTVHSHQAVPRFSPNDGLVSVGMIAPAAAVTPEQCLGVCFGFSAP